MVWITKAEDESASILPPSELPRGQAQAAVASNLIDYASNLNIMSMANSQRLSGIVCTIGPVSKAPEYLLSMLETGMNVARMNFSHGSHEYHGDTMKNCRTAAAMYKEKHGYDPCLAIALDTKGPEIRTGLLEGDDGRKELELEKGATIKLTTDESYKEKCTKDVLYLDYKNITKVLSPGKRVFIDDGLISVVAREIGDDYVIGEIENGGQLGSRKGCNLPGTDCDLPAVSEKDKGDLLFGVEQGVDMVFASFIRDAAGVREIRAVLGDAGSNIWIIPKIENQQGVNNIDEIIAEADGIMVARGDMGIEIPPEKVFIAQKQIIAKCNKAGKPVICATQMLESMVKKPRPTRAEGSDVANAILDGADCVMLSGETAKGDYPLQCIRTMANISREAEACLWNERYFQDVINSKNADGKAEEVGTSTAIAAVQASYNVKSAAIIAITRSGKTAREAAKYRPHCPILTITRDHQVARQIQLTRGCIPLFYDKERLDNFPEEVDARVKYAIDFAKENGLVKAGDHLVCCLAWQRGRADMIRIVTVD